MNQLPVGTVSFLFTDLEGSTRLWEEHSEAMREALARHDELIRDAIASHGGHVVKGTGDGVHAAFGSAQDAVGAAIDAQRELTAESWGEAGALRVRMGIHTGEAEQRAEDYYGTAVNRAARVMAAAHGGQVLVSDATALLLDRSSASYELVDLGEHLLRDLPHASRIFQVHAPGIERDFPPLRTAAFPGNLPKAATSFLGRTNELAALVQLTGSSRLVTLTGPGGVGKTTLATQVASDVSHAYSGGAWLCELASAPTGDSVVEVVAASLRVPARQGSTLEASLIEFLGPRPALLVFDNCEHVIAPAVALIDALLRACPGVRVLATSREPLGSDFEHVSRVAPLELPDSGASTDAIRATPTVSLFIERAHAAGADFDPDDATVNAIAEIARRLDGIPLAIELAAARSLVMHPSEIAEHLDERFQLLGRSREGTDRHRTLQATVDWSYDLLSERERVVFDLLGVFTGSFAVESVVSIVGDRMGAWDVLDALTGLVTKSMAIADVSIAGSRYSMLETLRAYAVEHLRAAGTLDAERRNHLRAFATFAEAAGEHLTGPDELVWQPRVVAELDNLRAAVAWGLDASPADRDLALRAISALVWEGIGHGELGIGAWAERAVHGPMPTEPRVRAGVYALAAWSLVGHLDLDNAAALADEALTHGLVAGGFAGSLAAQVQAVVAVVRDGNTEAALATMLGAYQEARGTDAGELAMWVCTFAHLAGDNATATAYGPEGVATARTKGSPSLLAAALWAYGTAVAETDRDLAVRCLDEAIALSRAGATRYAYSLSLIAAANLELQEGKSVGVAERTREAIAYLAAIGDFASLTETVFLAMAVFSQLGATRAAAELMGVVTRGVYRSSRGSLIAFDRDALESHLRDSLGPAAFEQALERGSIMTHNEIAERMLAELDLAITKNGPLHRAHTEE
jgi:predicted ATPase/class 3 adenylate cyclase